MIIRPLLRFFGGASIAFLLWGAVLLTLPFIGRSGRQFAVIADPAVVVAAGGRLIDVRGLIVLARSERPGFAAALYRQGATLVVEGRIAGGCFRVRSA